MLRYIFALSHNVLTLRRNIIASISYHSGLQGAVIASNSYRSKLIDDRIASLVINFRFFFLHFNQSNSFLTELEVIFNFFRRLRSKYV
jgi:hypothetical protein